MTQYEIEQQMAAQGTVLDPVEFSTVLKELCNDMANYKYTMLYCKERSDFTIFNNINGCPLDMMKELSATLCNRGKITYIKKINEKGGAWEIWIRDELDKPADHLYMLFDYSEAVIEF